ncbi:MAG: hypothetical protein M1837_002666 [Sclerophora amabilis]|nr:MAG: hypothetical protein M1837_002666 [Sclerophora amabilis]
MPEIGEIARLVHYLRKHLLGKTVSAVKVQEDNIVYGKAGTTADQFQKAITGKKVVDVGQQGKYFWMIMSSPPHPLLHCSMTGWFKFSNDNSGYYKPAKPEKESWPPRYWKFILETQGEPHTEAAFVDPRRLGRIRLIDCDGDKIRQTSPLDQNGPDPVIDKDKLTQDWFTKKVRSKRVPLKAFLLDQANISGVGNWVADEILYNAKIHPEQYTNSLRDDQLRQLHQSLLYVCSTAVDLLADSSKFPEEWLMKHRWGKGKKGNTLPNGERITHMTVGGRTSAVVPGVQRKTGPVAGDVDTKANGAGSGEESDDGETQREKKGAQKSTQRGAKKVNGNAKADTQTGSPAEDVKKASPKSGAKVNEEAKTSKNASSTSKKRKAPAEKMANDVSEDKKAPKKSKSELASVEARTGGRRSARIGKT